MEQAALDEVVAAINALPQPQREVLALFYVKDYPRQQIADFLGIPLTTVNNRLHTARGQLKRRLLPMAKDAFQTHALSDDFATNVGKLLEIRGPVVDLEFRADQLPPILAALTITDAARTVAFDAAVAQHLGNGRVRGVLSAPSHHLVPGMRAMPTGAGVDQPLGETMLSQALDLRGRRL